MKLLRDIALVVVLLAVAVALYRTFAPMPDLSEQTQEAPQVLEHNDMIRVTLPQQGDVITSPLTIEGEARGGWYFEASFPVLLTDWDGRIIAEGFAQAEGEWMTNEYVPFTATLTFATPAYGNTGLLVLKKDNPSDIREYDDAFEIPIRF